MLKICFQCVYITALYVDYKSVGAVRSSLKPYWIMAIFSLASLFVHIFFFGSFRINRLFRPFYIFILWADYRWACDVTFRTVFHLLTVLLTVLSVVFISSLAVVCLYAGFRLRIS